jgi:hypothetical protein
VNARRQALIKINQLNIPRLTALGFSGHGRCMGAQGRGFFIHRLGPVHMPPGRGVRRAAYSHTALARYLLDSAEIMRLPDRKALILMPRQATFGIRGYVRLRVNLGSAGPPVLPVESIGLDVIDEAIPKEPAHSIGVMCRLEEAACQSDGSRPLPAWKTGY